MFGHGPFGMGKWSESQKLLSRQVFSAIACSFCSQSHRSCASCATWQLPRTTGRAISTTNGSFFELFIKILDWLTKEDLVEHESRRMNGARDYGHAGDPTGKTFGVEAPRLEVHQEHPQLVAVRNRKRQQHSTPKIKMGKVNHVNYLLGPLADVFLPLPTNPVSILGQ